MNAALVAPIAVGCLLLGTVAGYFLRSSGSDGERARQADAFRARALAAESANAGLERRVADLEAAAQARTLAKREAGTTGPAMGTESPSATAPPGPAAPDAPVAAGDPGVRVAQADALLRDVDWAVVGANSSAMVPLLARLANSLGNGEPLPPETYGRIQELNGPLVTAALKAQAHLEGSTPNGAYTHPAFAANAIAAALAAAGLPLSASQRETIERLAVNATAEEARRVAGYGPDAFGLQKVLEESRLRGRFYDAAFAALTPEQSRALVPSELRGRMQADLFSAGLAWTGRAGPLAFVGREDLTASLERQVKAMFGLGEDRTAIVKEVVRDVVANLPADVVDGPHDPLASVGFLRVTAVEASAEAELAGAKRLLELGNFDAATAARIRAAQGVAVPARAKP